MYFSSLDPEVVAISIPILGVCGGVLIAITSILANSRKKEQEHRERLIALEKGIALPQQVEAVERPKFSNRRANGLVMTGIGLALTIAMGVADGPETGVWGLIPLFIGVGLLVAGSIDKREYEEKQRAEQNRRISA